MSTNPLDRLDGEIERWADVVGIFPNDRSVIRLAGALMCEQCDERAVRRGRLITLGPCLAAPSP